MKSVSEILHELIAVRSDTGTEHEKQVADKIYQLIMEQPYFQEHPELAGKWDGGDPLGRPIVWALKKGRGPKTVILSGHYDTVETSCYGGLEPYALSPQTLREHLKKMNFSDKDLMRDIRDEKWLFGRGSADMKAGLAINLHTLMSAQLEEVNILFTAVSDEENLSAGARQAIPFYQQIQTQHALQYELCIISEPGERDVLNDGPHQIIIGAAGKILPVVVAKGLPVHSSKMMSGVNSAHLISQIITMTEYNQDFVSQDQEVSTQPPAAQLMKDLKKGYDVSLPEYTAAAFNMTFFKATNPADLLQKLVQICSKAVDNVQQKWEYAFKDLLQIGSVLEGEEAIWDKTVLTVKQLEERLQEKPGFIDFRAKTTAKVMEMVQGGETLLMASIHYIRELMVFSEIDAPMVVVGIAPPFYPAVNCTYLDRDITTRLHQMIERVRQDHHIKAHILNYSHAMTDMSYTSCADPEGARTIMENISLPSELYAMDVEAMNELNIPTIMIGPARRDIHQIGERVYLPDVTDELPAIFAELIRSYEREGRSS